MKLMGKVSVITGGADGIGAEIARVMAREGARVVVVDIQEDKGRAIVNEISKAGGTAHFVLCDVGDDANVRSLIDETIKRFQTLHVLVNNAGVAIGGTITEMLEEDWQKALNIDVSSVYRTCKYAIPYMKKDGGSIINIASTQAHVGFPGWTAYAAAKGGVIAMTQQLAVEFAPYNIRVNCISPGTIRTPLNEKLLSEAPDPQSLMNEWVSWHPMGRIGEPHEVANAVTFLASEEASFITGVDLRVDGGQVLRP